MSETSFHEDRAKEETRKAIADIEAKTAAEVVVTLRSAAGSHRAADYLAGFLLSLVALFVMLFAEFTFSLMAFPAGIVLSFAVGAFVCSRLPRLRMALTGPRARHEAVRTAARAAFVDQGVSRTRDRTGILVFVAMTEREVEVVADIGVDEKALGDAYKRAVEELRGALRPSPSLDTFLAKLRALGPPLAAGLPRAADDVNELPDEVLS